MLNQADIENQRLLGVCRRTLAHLLLQAAQYGGVVFAPPQTANGIAQARAQISQLKSILRERGIPVENEPNDDAPFQVDPFQIDQLAAITSALHQLPAPTPDFEGHEREIDQLIKALSK